MSDDNEIEDTEDSLSVSEDDEVTLDEVDESEELDEVDEVE